MLRKKTQWINTRTVWKWDGEKYVQISNEGYEYDGPLALAHNQAATDQQSYRIYASDNSTTVAAENATASCDVDTPYVCRILIENNGDIAEDTQTYSLEYQNTTQATGWQPVSGASSHVQTADASGLTNGTAVTSATLTGQAAATFTNGEEIEDAVGPSIGLAADNYTEYWFAFQLIGADVANNDNIQLRVVGDTLGVLDGYTNTPTITAVEASPTTVTITSDSFTLTDGTMTITQSNPTTVTMTPDSFTLTDGTLTIRAEQETRVTPTADTFTLTDATMGVTQTPVITLVPDSLVLTDGTMTINQGASTTVTIIPDSFTLTDGTLTIRAEQETRITPIADTFTLSDGTLTIRAEQETRVTPIADTFTLTDGTMTIRAEQEGRITPIADTLTLTDGVMSVVQASVEERTKGGSTNDEEQKIEEKYRKLKEKRRKKILELKKKLDAEELKSVEAIQKEIERVEEVVVEFKQQAKVVFPVQKRETPQEKERTVIPYTPAKKAEVYDVKRDILELEEIVTRYEQRKRDIERDIIFVASILMQ